MATTVAIDGRTLAERITVRVRVRITRGWRWRWTVARLLIHLGARIGGFGFAADRLGQVDVGDGSDG